MSKNRQLTKLYRKCQLHLKYSTYYHYLGKFEVTVN